MNDNDRRWVELQFYYICFDIYNINHELPDVLDYIQFARNLTKFDMNIVVDCAQRVLTFRHHRPTREELIILGAYADVKMTDIKKYLDLNNRDYYKVVKNARKNPPFFYPHMAPEEIPAIQQFINFHNIIKEVGFNGKRTQRDTVETF